MKLIKKKIVDDFNGLGEMVEIPSSKIYTNNQTIYVCKNSGLVRAKNLRSAKAVATAWSDEVYSNKFDENRETYTARIPAVKARHTYVADFAHMHLDFKDKVVCDIGAGEGQFFEIISQNNYQANCFGIEPSKKNCEQILKKNFDCFVGTIEEYTQSNSINEKKFDIITIMWTLVNSSSCLNMIKSAFMMLKPGGHIVVAEGSRILVPFKKPLHKYFSKLSVDLHPYHFSANSLSNLLQVVGFEITEINSYIDSDYLCLIAKKVEKLDNESFEVDNYNDVLSYFERWHNETEKYYKDK